MQSVFRKEKPRPSAEALKPVLITYAEQIVEAVAPTVKLDYSPQSIQDIENVLSGIHDGYLKSGDDTGLNGIALEFAAYIVEVIKRNYGPVKWDRDGSEFGPIHIHYPGEENTYFHIRGVKNAFLTDLMIMCG